jgi:hypothetical protein
VRRAARTDENQTAIVEALRNIGAMVVITSAVGDGVPDLLVGYRGHTLLLEVKDGDNPPSERVLTRAQEIFHTAWGRHGGPIAVALSPADAIAVVKAVCP